MADTYSKATFYVMSGTGNSYRAAAWMADTAAASGADARVLPVDQRRPPEPIDDAPGQLVTLLMPAHGFTAPWQMIRFALGLPRRHADAAVVVTRAGTKIAGRRLPGMEGTACWLIALILAIKGYRIRGVLGLDMPFNWTAAVPGLCDESVADILAHAEPPARQFATDLLAGRRRLGGWVALVVGLVLAPVSLAYLLMARFLLAKIFFANPRCTGCGQCAANCPSGSLRMVGRKNPRPYWSITCESCMRCMAYCPAKAVEAGWSLGAILYYVTGLPVVVWLLAWLAPPARWAEALGMGWVQGVLGYVYFLAALAVCYAVFQLLIRLRPINLLFTYTTPTFLYRRYHEPATTLADLAGEDPSQPPAA